MDGDPPKSGKRLQAAVLRYDALAVCAPTAYQASAARPGVHSEVALRLTEALRGASPGLHPPRRANDRRSWRRKRPPWRRTSATFARS